MSRKGRVGTSLAALLAAAVLAVGGAAFAQESGGAQGAPSAPSSQQSAEDFSKEDLQQFAEVSSKIQEIGKRYQPKVASAQDASAKQKVMQDMQKEMVETVRASDLDVGTYNSIARAVQSDEELRKKIEGMD